ncbi:hypothetical protein BJ944DRAFT_34778 [Cunninghamella echinulata]|nr:hypothetical protein BJ944DRAFT_34778 [Cunninghamella echinulata]
MLIKYQSFLVLAFLIIIQASLSYAKPPGGLNIKPKATQTKCRTIITSPKVTIITKTVKQKPKVTCIPTVISRISKQAKPTNPSLQEVGGETPTGKKPPTTKTKCLTIYPKPKVTLITKTQNAKPKVTCTVTVAPKKH